MPFIKDLPKEERTPIGPFTVSNPFSLTGPINDHENVKIEIDLSDLVDGYSYHDYPSSVDVYMTKETLVALRDRLNLSIKKFKKRKRK